MRIDEDGELVTIGQLSDRVICGPVELGDDIRHILIHLHTRAGSNNHELMDIYIGIGDDYQSIQ
jgi:hypothetical protein